MRVTYDRDDTIETKFSLVVINKTSQNINATLNNNTKSNNNTNPNTTRPPTPKKNPTPLPPPTSARFSLPT